MRDDLVAAAQRVERDAEHRDVVGLLRAVRKRVHARGDGLACLVRRQARVAVEHGKQAVLAVHVLLGVARLGDAVGVEEQAVAGEQRHGVLAVLDAVHAGQEEVRLGHAQVLVVSAGAAHEGRVVAGVRKRERAGGEVEDAEPRGHEHAALVGLAQAPVGLGEGRVHVQARLYQRVDLSLGLHHEQRRGHALAGDVGDEHHETVAIEHEEVIEVAAHLARGLHACVDVEVVALGERREHARQRGVLDMARQLQLGVVTVLSLLDVALERVDGGVHVVRELGELLVRAHVDHGVQVAGRDLVQAVAHAVQVANHAPVQQAVEHRDERDVDDDLGEHHQVAGHGVVVVGLVAGQKDHDGPVAQSALHHVTGDVADLQRGHGVLGDRRRRLREDAVDLRVLVVKLAFGLAGEDLARVVLVDDDRAVELDAPVDLLVDDIVPAPGLNVVLQVVEVDVEQRLGLAARDVEDDDGARDGHRKEGSDDDEHQAVAQVADEIGRLDVPTRTAHQAADGHGEARRKAVHGDHDHVEGIDKDKGRRDARVAEQQDEHHVERLDAHRDAHGVAGGGRAVAKGPAAREAADDTREHRGYRTRGAGGETRLEVQGVEPAPDAADDARDDTGRSSKAQRRRHGGRVARVDQAVGDRGQARLGVEHRNEAKGHTDHNVAHPRVEFDPGLAVLAEIRKNARQEGGQ